MSAASGPQAEGLITYVVPRDSKVERVLQRGRTERVDALVDDPEANVEATRRFGATTGLFAPLIVRGRAIGVIDIRKDVLANFPPTGGDSIVASAPPTLSSADHASSSSLTGWTTSVTAGDVLRFHLTSSSSVKRLTVVLTYTRI